MHFSRQASRAFSTSLTLLLMGTPALGQQDWATAPGGIAKAPESNEPSRGGCAKGDLAAIMRRINDLAQAHGGQPQDSGSRSPDRDEKCKDDKDGDGGGGGKDGDDEAGEGKQNAGGGTPAPWNPADGFWGDMIDDPAFLEALLDELFRRMRDLLLDPRDTGCPRYTVTDPQAYYNSIRKGLGDQAFPPGTHWDGLVPDEDPPVQKEQDPCERIGILNQMCDTVASDDSWPYVHPETPPPSLVGPAAQPYDSSPIAYRKVRKGIPSRPDTVVDKYRSCSQCPPGDVVVDLNGLQVLLPLGSDSRGDLGYILMRSDTLLGGDEDVVYGGIIESLSASSGGGHEVTLGPGAAEVATRNIIQLELDRSISAVDKEAIYEPIVSGQNVQRPIRQLRVKDLYVDFKSGGWSDPWKFAIRFYKLPVQPPMAASPNEYLYNFVNEYGAPLVPYKELHFYFSMTWMQPSNANSHDDEMVPAPPATVDPWGIFRVTGSFICDEVVGGQLRHRNEFRQSLNIQQVNPAPSNLPPAQRFQSLGTETWSLIEGNKGSPTYRKTSLYYGSEFESIGGGQSRLLTSERKLIWGNDAQPISDEVTYFRWFPEWPATSPWSNGWLAASQVSSYPYAGPRHWSDELLLRVKEPARHVTDPDGANLVTTWDYDGDPGLENESSSHHITGQTAPSGHWERYIYDSHGWLIKKVSQYLDHTEAQGESQNRVERFGRSNSVALFSVGSGSDTTPEQITWRTEEVMGSEVARSFTINWANTVQLDGNGDPIPTPDDVTEIRCAPDATGRFALPNDTALKTWLESVLTDPFATPHLVSHERRFSRDEVQQPWLRGRLDVRLESNGTVTRYFHRSYPLPSGSTAPTLADYGVFQPPSGQPLSQVQAQVIRMVKGPAALTGCFPLKPGANLMPRDGIITVKVEGPSGQVLLRETRDLQGALGAGNSRLDVQHNASGPASWPDTLVTSRTVATNWTTDAFGRPTEFTALDGSLDTRTFSDCCGSGTDTDATGLTTLTTKDQLGRVTMVTSALGTPAQQSTIYEYDALDRTIKAIRVGADDSTMLQSETGYDVAGREAWTKDQLGDTTSFAYTLAAGSITNTTTMPDPDGTGPLAAPVSIDVAYPDGHAKETSGTAVHATRMEYGVETDAALAGGTPVLFTRSIRLGDGSPANTDAWSKTYTDSLGRGYRSTSPAADGTTTILESRSTFGTRGRLLASIDASGVKTLRLEGHGPEEAPASSGTTDWAGDWTIQALDVNGNGVIDFGVTATDRISRSRSFTTQRTDGSVVSTVQRSVSDVWDSSGTPYVITTSTSDSSVDGRKSWSASFGVLTNSRSSDDAPTSTSTQVSVSPDGNESVSISQYGRPISAANYIGTVASGTLQAMVTYTYDAHGRQIKVTDTRGTPTDTSDDRETIATYDNADRVLTVTSPPAEVGQPSTVVTNTYDALGRVTRTESQTGGVETNITTNTEYYPTGEASKIWGGESYPVEYTYDAVGRMKTLKTRQKSRDLDNTISQVVSDSTAAVTTWNYDSKSGLLLQKLYPHATTAGATGVGPSYTYFADGKLKRRTWARGAYADYIYSANTGELLSVTYSDGTPTVTYEYDRRGRVKSLIDGAGTRSFEYDVSDQPKVEQYTAGILNGLKTTISYDAQLRRSIYQLTMGTGANNTRAYNVLGYDALSRLSTVTRGSFVTTYTYKPHSSLLSGLQHTAGAITTGSAAYTHDNLDRVKSLTWTMNPGGTPTTDAFAYRYDAKGHRDRATDPDGSYWKFQYDTLGQVTSGRRYMPAGVAQSEDDDLDVPGYRFGYSFDHIGNRTATTATDGVPSFSTLPRLATYSANLLNQYTERTVPRVLDIAGYAPGTLTVDSQAVWRSGLAAPYDQYYWFPKEWPSVNSAFAAGVTVSHLAQPLNVFLPATPEQFTYDADGNLTQDGRWNYSWDGENRLVAMEVRDELKPLFAQPLRLQFSYDSQHRRVRKVVLVPNPPSGGGGTGNANSGGGGGGNIEENPEVLTPSGMTGIDEGATEIEPGTTLASTINVGWTVITDIRFAWDGWLLSAELNNSGGLIRGYCWGIDLSGSRGGAAGIGGLLYTQDGGNALTNSNIRYVTSDSRGDVRAVYNSSGTLQARFEYGPFGEPTAVAGSASSSFPIRFSSKYADQETGLSYFGRRYVSASVGRWLNRDPVEEAGSVGLSTFVNNNSLNAIDPTGMWGTPVHHAMVDDWLDPYLPSTDYSQHPWGCDKVDVKQILKDNSDLVDGENQPSGPIAFLGAQGTATAYEHAMSAGSEPKSAAQAKYNSFVNTHVAAAYNKGRNARKLLQNKKSAESLSEIKSAVAELGQVFHAFTDKMSPSHSGFQPWYGPYDGPMAMGAFAYGVYTYNHFIGETLAVYSASAASHVADLNQVMFPKLKTLLRK